MSEIGIMHVLDTLALGGAERAAVDLVNNLPRARYRSYLCTTRGEGPLAGAVLNDVGRIALSRGGRFDIAALRQLVAFIRRENIAILHAHGSSLFFAVAAAWFRPRPHVIWHAHYGRLALEDRRALAHRVAIRRTDRVITVNHQLAEWCRRRLGASDRVAYIPNMVRESAIGGGLPNLAGTPGSRIVCVANLRKEKDHVNLIQAMALVVRRHSEAHLLLVGAHSDPLYSATAAYFEAVKAEVARHSLGRNVSFLGQRQDVPAILRSCDIGVLSSKTEGLPVSLLEYGMAGLPAVATDVGECSEVLDGGRAGMLVPSESPDDLADALLALIQSPERRKLLGEAFSQRVKERYGTTSIMTQVCGVYDAVLSANPMVMPVAGSIHNSLRV